MARKILISFLGTGSLDRNVISSRKYLEATYQYKGQSINTSFITKALDELFQPDCILVFGTMKSMWEGLWQELDNKSQTIEKEDDILNLGIKCENSDHTTSLDETIFQKMIINIPKKWKLFLIHYGWREDEIEANFEIFSRALDTLQNDDEIILDITHSFRSLPIFANTAINFINTVSGKNLRVIDILYGMLDIQREFNGITPVVSLNYMVEIQNWTKGGYTFLKYGESELISMLLAKDDIQISQKIQDFSIMLAMNYMHELPTQISVLKSLKISGIKSKPAQLVVPNVVKSFIHHFKGCKVLSEFQFALADWHFKNQNYALSYLCLIESIVTMVCEKENIPTSGESPRKKAKAIMKNNVKYIPFYNIFKPANKTRNQLAHVTGLKVKKSIEEVQKLNTYLTEFKKLYHAH